MPLAIGSIVDFVLPRQDAALLNIIAIGLMLPTFVVSAFSMNVEFPLKNHPYAFWLILGVAGIAVTSMIFYMRWRRW